MEIINPQSDLKIFISNEELCGLPRLRFEFRYFTNDKDKYVSASFDGAEYKHCEECEGGVLAYWPCPNFYPDYLRVQRHVMQPDQRFESRVFNQISSSLTNIYINDGSSLTMDEANRIGIPCGVKGEIGPPGPIGPEGPNGPIDRSYTDEQMTLAASMLDNKAIGSGTFGGNVLGNWAGLGSTQAETFRGNIVLRTTSTYQGFRISLPVTSEPTVISFYARTDQGPVVFQSATNLTLGKPHKKSSEAILGAQWKQYWIYFPKGCCFSNETMGVVEFLSPCSYTSVKVECPATRPSEWSPAWQDKLNTEGDASRLWVNKIPLIVDGRINPALL